jgi:hypothetical protein
MEFGERRGADGALQVSRLLGADRHRRVAALASRERIERAAR